MISWWDLTVPSGLRPSFSLIFWCEADLLVRLDRAVGVELVARAVNWDRIELAHDAADELAAEDPTDAALVRVRAHRLASQGRTAAAATIPSAIRKDGTADMIPALRALADRIIEFDPHRDAWRSILDEIDPARDAVAGEWMRWNGAIVCEAGRFVRLAVPTELPPSYELELLCSRLAGNGSVNLILPVGDHSVQLVLDGWPERNGLSALDRVRGKAGPDNATRTTAFRLRAPPLKNHVHITVQTRGDSVAVDVVVDGAVLISWKGPVEELALLENWSLGKDGRSLGLGAYSARAAFQRLRIRPIE
jgi:hypothetical protein